MKRIEHDGIRVDVRNKTSDEKAFQEVVVKQAYKRKYFKPEPEDHWLDLGANIGAFSCWVLATGAKCISIEAEEENASLAEHNLRLNGHSAKVKQMAVTHDMDEREFAPFYLSNTEYAQWRHSLSNINGNRKNARNVKLVRFSELLEPAINAVKMDIEGAEIEILERVMDFRNVRKLVFEYHFDVDDRVVRYNAILARLGGFFQNIRAARIKPEIERYTHFPQAKIVFAWNE